VRLISCIGFYVKRFLCKKYGGRIDFTGLSLSAILIHGKNCGTAM